MEYTPEQLNYFRFCYIVFNLVPQGLRQVFKMEWDFLYKNYYTLAGEWQDIPQNGKDFTSKESKKKNKLNAQYLATITNGNSAEWDSSCLFFAILFSDSVGKFLNPGVYKDVDELRKVRNEIAHINSVWLTDVEFQHFVGRVVNSFTSLGLQTRAINSIAKQKSFPTSELKNLESQINDLKIELKKTGEDLEQAQKEADALREEIDAKFGSFCNLAFKPSHEIIRRSNEVNRIMTKMKQLEDESNGSVSTIFLSGNPGCGKTELARQIGEELFAKRNCDGDRLTFVANLNAETPETLADSYMTLAKDLGVTEYALTNIASSKAMQPEERIQDLKRLIKPKIRKFSTWLIIADNVVDLALVRCYFPLTGSEEWGHGQVLITTQDSSTIPSNDPHTYSESLTKGMQPDDAVELLKEVSQHSSTQEELKKVAEVLDYQPLALAAAAYYVRTVLVFGSPSYNWTKYLSTLNEGKREVTEEALAKQSGAYSKTMTAAIKLAIRRAVETDKVFRELFSFLSLCASDSVPLEAVVRFVKARLTDQTEEIIRAKIVTSTLILSSCDEDEAVRYLQTHSIVYEVTRMERTFICKGSSERLQCIATAIRVFTSLIPEDRKPLSREACVLSTKVATHSKALFTNVASCVSAPGGMLLEDLTPFVSPDDFVWWLVSVADVCRELTELSLAKFFIQSAHDLLRHISHTKEGKRLKGNVLTSYGSILSQLSQKKLALSYTKKGMKILKTVLGKENCDVAASYDNLGLLHRDIGECSQAKKFHEKALMIKKKNYCEEHDDVAASYNNLGLLYSDIEEHSKAEEFHEKALRTRKTIHGEDHGSVAESYNNFGNVYRDTGRHDQAKEFYERALKIRKNIYGEEHGDVATSCDNLGLVYRATGQYDKANESHERAFMIRKKIYGEEHGDVATSYNNLGLLYSDIGKNGKAKEFHEKALMIRKKIYGEEHGDVASSYNNLGLVHRAIGQPTEAKEFYEKAMSIRKNVYGETHGDVAASYSSLGQAYSDKGQYDKASVSHEKALKIRIKVYGEEHGNVAESYNNLGLVYKAIGLYDKAKKFHEKALMIREKCYGQEHGDVAESYNNLGLVYRALGKYNKARELYEKALLIEKKLHGEEHADVAATYNNLGVVHSATGQHEIAKQFHEKSLEIKRKIYSEENGDVARSYSNLGVLYRETGQHHKAKEFHEKALMIRIKLHGKDHGDVATSYNNLGQVYSAVGRHGKAKEFHAKALNIRKKLHGEDHDDVATSLNNLGQVYSAIGQPDKAKKVHENALKIRIKIYGEGHGALAESYSNLGLVYGAIEKYGQAKEFHEKALTIRQQIYGENNDFVAESYNNLGLMYTAIEQYGKATKLHEKALTIWKMNHGEEHGDVAASYHNLGVVYSAIGQLEKAKEIHEKALKIKRRIHGEENASVATSYHNLGRVLESLGRYWEAYDYEKKALYIRGKLEWEENETCQCWKRS